MTSVRDPIRNDPRGCAMKPLSFGVAYRHVHFPSRAVEPRTTRKPASERTPGLQKAAREGPQSAQLRRPPTRFSTSGLRRLRPSVAQGRCVGVNSDKRTIWSWAPMLQHEPRGGPGQAPAYGRGLTAGALLSRSARSVSHRPHTIHDMIRDRNEGRSFLSAPQS